MFETIIKNSEWIVIHDDVKIITIAKISKEISDEQFIKEIKEVIARL
jgi:hypothetical protein